MLVLSRKQDQAVCFPALGISIKVCQLLGNKVRIGIDAPEDVTILRDELCDSQMEEEIHKKKHERKNLLNATHVALSLAQTQLEKGFADDAQVTLDQALKSLSKLELADYGETRVSHASPTYLKAKVSKPSNPEAGSHPNNTDAKPVKRALVVEDNDNERELLAGFLRLSGFEVETAANGLEAIKQLSKADELPQAVILDMRMPKLDGAKTISNIRKREEMKNLRVIAVSGTSPQEMNVSVGSRGVNCWFEKPVDPTRLVEHLNSDIDELAPGYKWPLGVSFAAEKTFAQA